MGRHTKKGYVLEPWRERTFVVPDLSDFQVVDAILKLLLACPLHVPRNHPNSESSQFP